MSGKRLTLTRDEIRNDAVRRMIAEGGLPIRLLSDDELAESRRRTLDGHPPDADVWVFAYGSLIWNPAFHFAERCIGTVEGWHRQFCLWVPLGRGTPETPGLILGLEDGGRCQGVVYRVAATEAEAELDIVWRREMIAGSYTPHWVEVATETGPLRAVTFVINRAAPHYAGRLTEDQQVEHIALASGALGRCSDYLFSTVEHLEQLGIHDPLLARIRGRVAERCRAAGI